MRHWAKNRKLDGGLSYSQYNVDDIFRYMINSGIFNDINHDPKLAAGIGETLKLKMTSYCIRKRSHPRISFESTPTLKKTGYFRSHIFRRSTRNLITINVKNQWIYKLGFLYNILKYSLHFTTDFCKLCSFRFQLYRYWFVLFEHNPTRVEQPGGGDACDRACGPSERKGETQWIHYCITMVFREIRKNGPKNSYLFGSACIRSFV